MNPRAMREPEGERPGDGAPLQTEEPPPEIVRVLAADDLVRSIDESVRTGDENVVTADERVRTPVVTPRLAAGALRAAFGPVLDADYVPGKTELRDALCERFELSQLEAEELCDDLERARLVRFVDEPTGFGWHIHEEAEEVADRAPGEAA